jgi:hypothetical protein
VVARAESGRGDRRQIVRIDRGDAHASERQANHIARARLRDPAEAVRHEAIRLQKRPPETRLAHGLLGKDVVARHGVARVPARSSRAREQDDALDACPSHRFERHRQLLVAAEQKHRLNLAERRSQALGPVEIAHDRLDACRPGTKSGSGSHERAHTLSIRDERPHNRPACIPGRPGHEKHHRLLKRGSLKSAPESSLLLALPLTASVA